MLGVLYLGMLNTILQLAQPQKPVSNFQTETSVPLFSVDEADLFNFSDEVNLVLIVLYIYILTLLCADVVQS